MLLVKVQVTLEFFWIVNDTTKFFCVMDDEQEPEQLTEHDIPVCDQPAGTISESVYWPTFKAKLPVEPEPPVVAMLGASGVGPVTLKLKVPLAAPDFLLIISVPVAFRVFITVQILLSPGLIATNPLAAQPPPMTEV